MLWLMLMAIVSWICQTAVDYVVVVIGYYFISTTDYLLPRHELLVGDCAHFDVEKVEFPERDVPFASHIYMRTISSNFLRFTTSGIYTSSLTKARVRSSNPCISSLLSLEKFLK